MKYRRVYDKYIVNNAAAGLILKRKTTVISTLLQWIEDSLHDDEHIDVHEWVDERFYIEVIRTGDHAQLLGITINVDTDEVIYITPTKNDPFGGNCFVRGERWKRLLCKHYGKYILIGFHTYKGYLYDIS